MRFRPYLCLISLLAVCLAGNANADSRIENFFGTYTGFGFATDDSGPFIRTERNFELVIGLNRAKPEQALRRLEFMFAEIYQTLLMYPSVTFLGLESLGNYDVGGVEHFGGRITMTVKATMANIEGGG